MGTLTPFLQHEFRRLCPAGWQCSHEVDLIPPALAAELGYTARADVLLEQSDPHRRIWVEFEVSRADPVANRAKFATSHLFDPRPPTARNTFSFRRTSSGSRSPTAVRVSPSGPASDSTATTAVRSASSRFRWAAAVGPRPASRCSNAGRSPSFSTNSATHSAGVASYRPYPESTRFRWPGSADALRREQTHCAE